jgi:hypothetical protein
LETELNLDPDSNPDPEMDPGPNLQIISDPAGSECTTMLRGFTQQPGAEFLSHSCLAGAVLDPVTCGGAIF